MPPIEPSREALALLREWLEDLESRLAAEKLASQGQESAAEREDRELAEAWAARGRTRKRLLGKGKRCGPIARKRKVP